MYSNLFVVFCVILFLIISLYTIFDIIFNRKLFDIRKLFIFLYSNSLTSIFLLLTTGFIFLILYGIITSNFYVTSINEITHGNGLAPFGDYFNGLITPIVSIVSIIYIYKAFIQQYRANEMLYNFELKRDLKENLDWLRNNSGFLKVLETNINGFNREELETYFLTEKEDLNKLVYTVLVFQDLLTKTKKNNEDLKYNTEIILMSFYIKSYKSIFRDINSYIINTLQIDDEYLNDLTKVEINYALKFIELYENIKATDTEKQFIYTVTEVKNIIEYGNK